MGPAGWGRGVEKGIPHGHSGWSLRLPLTLQVEKRMRILAILTSGLLWPERWAGNLPPPVDMARREGVQHTAGETRARQQAELPTRTSEFPRAFENRCHPGGFRRGPFCTMAGAGGRTPRAASRRGDWKRERTPQPFSRVWPGFFTKMTPSHPFGDSQGSSKSLFSFAPYAGPVQLMR